MRSIREIFVIGHGPSSSHTMGPSKSAVYILEKYQNIKHIKVTLYGSLASTGPGHLTDYIIDLKLKNVPHDIIFDHVTIVDHPNTLIFETTTKEGVFTDKIVSIGGGTIKINDEIQNDLKEIYPHRYMKDIIAYCDTNNLSLADYVIKFEGPEILDYVKECYSKMNEAKERGVHTEGYLPGDLHVQRKAPIMYKRLMEDSEPFAKRNYDLIIAIGAMACAEENASGGEIVIAPTCGSCGVIPGCLSYLEARGSSLESMLKGLLVAGLVGMICKTNASVSGAECGCQAEIGVACAMGAAMISYVKGMFNYKISEAAEIALEHSLGLTCDPVKGLVQIPCIERNAMYALKAKNAFALTQLIPGKSQVISFDNSVETMYKTGKDLQAGYRETSEKGLADLIK